MIHIDMPENAASMVTLNLGGKNLCSFNDLKKFKNLIELDLSENNFKFPIPNLQNLKYLKRLNLSYNQISEFWVFPESLEILVLNSNLISSFKSPLGYFKSLTTLDLSYNMLCDVGPISKITSLKYLFLKNNHLIKSSPLLELTSLNELDLESNEISDLQDLKKWEAHCSIAVLNIKGNPAVSNLGPASQESLFDNLGFVKDLTFAKSSKHFKNSLMLFNNNKRNLTNKSMINRSLMQNKQEKNSSFSETITSEEEPPESGKNVHNEGEDVENTNFFETKTTHLDTDMAGFKARILTPTNQNTLESIPATKKIKKLFLNTSEGMIQSSIPVKVNKINTNTHQNNHNTGLSFDQNASFLNSVGANQTFFEVTQPGFGQTTNSPLIFNKTVEKFKTLLTNNDRKVHEKYQNKEPCIVKRPEKKNMSALFGKDEKDQDEFSYKQTTESLIKKNHQLQIENYNLRKSINSDKAALNQKLKRLYELVKSSLDRSLSPQTKFELNDLDSLIEIIERNIAQAVNLDMKSKILHQFDNLRDYYRKKIECLNMRINELESQIAFQIKPMIQTQQQTIEFYKSRVKSLNQQQEYKGVSDSFHSRSSNSKHSRTRSLNCQKVNKPNETLSNTEKLRIERPDIQDLFAANQDRMNKYMSLLRNTVQSLSSEVQFYKIKGTRKKKESNSSGKKNTRLDF